MVENNKAQTGDLRPSDPKALKPKKKVKQSSPTVKKPSTTKSKSSDKVNTLSPEQKAQREHKRQKAHERWYQRRQGAAQLEKCWPALFSDPPKPLAIGIRQALIAETNRPSGEDWIKQGLSYWCGSYNYQKAIVAGGARYNCQGEPEGQVTEKEQAYAQFFLERICQKHQVRKTTKKP